MNFMLLCEGKDTKKMQNNNEIVINENQHVINIVMNRSDFTNLLIG